MLFRYEFISLSDHCVGSPMIVTSSTCNWNCTIDINPTTWLLLIQHIYHWWAKFVYYQSSGGFNLLPDTNLTAMNLMMYECLLRTHNLPRGSKALKKQQQQRQESAIQQETSILSSISSPPPQHLKPQPRSQLNSFSIASLTGTTTGRTLTIAITTATSTTPH